MHLKVGMLEHVGEAGQGKDSYSPADSSLSTMAELLTPVNEVKMEELGCGLHTIAGRG